jgi:hypothetical protein
MPQDNHHSSEADSDDYSLLPRSIVHPSTKRKLTRLFYGAILSLFILLIVSLIGWFLWHSYPA